MPTCSRTSKYEPIVTRYISTVRANPYIPHEPTDKQAFFLLHDHVPEILFGGAAGGGKSDALLMAALQYVHVPGYAALLLRRTYPDLALPGAIMDRAHEWLQGTDAQWHEKEKTWVFPSGATLTFGYLDGPRDHFRYQGAEFQFIGFDELTQFKEQQYLYLHSRLRRLAELDVPIRMRAASNPGDIGHEWVKARFVVSTDPSRMFIPATLDDNPYLDRETYIESLQKLDPVTREQLLAGNWDVRLVPGMFFRREWFEIVDRAPVCDLVVRYWDFAGSKPTSSRKDPDWTVGLLLGYKPPYFYVLDVVRMQESPGTVEARVIQTAEIDGRAVPVIIEQEPGSSSLYLINSLIDQLPGYAVTGVPSTGSKQTRAKPVSSAVEHGKVKIVRGEWNREFLAELEYFPEGAHDDQVDALSGAHTALVDLWKLLAMPADDVVTYDDAISISPV